MWWKVRGSYNDKTGKRGIVLAVNCDREEVEEVLASEFVPFINIETVEPIAGHILVIELT